ncbi:MAG: sn-glycerol-3-phosphate ABC transporter ATP-binding protein UgpC [Pyrinomonadaceae bacterium]|nr:sn-glycerol-3-phosphate ABC transporter ATP-binding protein UgpC [Phycisphaerales bacterium]
MANVRFHCVSKVFPNGHVAVDQLSLDIADGEFVVLVGPSGCGKSTTLRLLAGLEEATGGTISIADREVNGVHPKDRDIAMVFQNYALYPHMSVYKNMAFALKLRRVPKPEIERRVNEAAKMLGLDELLERKPRQLSGGQRQRVAVGRAIVREPKAFLFDEPLSNLDAKLRVSTRAELKALHQRLRTTTIYVTHDQEEAMTLGDRVVVMNGGVIRQAAPPLEVYRRPADRFVASFIGTPPMNFVEGILTPAGAGLVFVERGGGADKMGLNALDQSAPGLIRVQMAGEATAKLAAHVGKEVVLGIRPQHLTEQGPGTGQSSSVIIATIKVIEPLGDQMDLHVECSSGARLVARISAREGLKADQLVRLAVDPASVLVFESGAAGRNLLL